MDVRVVSVVDGNTLVVVDDRQERFKVVVAAVAAPQFGQPFHDQATTSLSALTFRRTVTLRSERLFPNGVRVATIMAPNPKCHEATCPRIIDVGLLQVSAGMAWWMRDSATQQSPAVKQEYEVAEFRAKARRLGLWADRNPVAPWLWRRALAEPRHDGFITSPAPGRR
ncbi:MAG: thermonuclease family protein [Gammaproteobacteria bacterium]|nr:thermonuclease family protein [Gammaproteobacteria bacterium]MBU1416836.1 thermonuclease family protein [Gammaproteobacteria bacterium]